MYEDEYDDYPCSKCSQEEYCDGWERQFCCTLCHYYNEDPWCDDCDSMDI